MNPTAELERVLGPFDIATDPSSMPRSMRATLGGEVMVRRLGLFIFVVALGLALVIPATAQDFERHPHMLVLGIEFDESGEPVAFRKCIDLAANQALPLNAQHVHMHFGTAGAKLFENASNVVVPGAPFPAPFADPVPWSNCEELIAFFFGE